MPKKYFSIIFFTTSLIYLGCVRSKPISRFNSKKWEAKKGICYVYRLEMKDELYQIEDELLGKNEDNLVEILGKPDKQDLHKRGQKQYTYYLHCIEKNEFDSEEKIVIRLNALNRITGIEYNF